MTDQHAIAHADDERGHLVAVELDALDFPARRVFVATGAATGSVRGDHLVPCLQLMVLISGTVQVQVGGGPDSLGSARRLETPGDSVRLLPGQYVRYHLRDSASSVLVIAEDRYGAPRS